jgi:hypothetical protein
MHIKHALSNDSESRGQNDLRQRGTNTECTSA